MNQRRSFLSKFLAGSATLLASPLAFSQKNRPFQPIVPQSLPELKGRKILFTYGGWPGHEPKVFKDYMVPWLESQGAEVIAHNHLEAYADETFMATIDLVVQQFTMSEITREQEAGLLKAIRENGTGMAGWHGGMGDSFRFQTEYQFMVGGQWVAHPGGNLDYIVKIADKQDPIIEGITDFPIHSEQYYMHVDPNVNVLATTQFNGEASPWINGCTMPVIWKKGYGKGRVFYSSLGHSIFHVTQEPAEEAMEMIKRGIQWASASKYEPMEEWVSAVY